jgi:hypothetical protein
MGLALGDFMGWCLGVAGPVGVSGNRPLAEWGPANSQDSETSAIWTQPSVKNFLCIGHMWQVILGVK